MVCILNIRLVQPLRPTTQADMPLPLSVPLPFACALVRTLRVEVAFTATAALYVEVVCIILHKGNADPLLPSHSPTVAVSSMPATIGTTSRTR